MDIRSPVQCLKHRLRLGLGHPEERWDGGGLVPSSCTNAGGAVSLKPHEQVMRKMESKVCLIDQVLR